MNSIIISADYVEDIEANEDHALVSDPLAHTPVRDDEMMSLLRGSQEARGGRKR